MNNKKIKFILEIDEQYIDDHTNVEKVIEGKKDPQVLLNALLDGIAFKSLKGIIERDNKTEFVINELCLNDDKERSLFKSSITYCAALLLPKENQRENLVINSEAN